MATTQALYQVFEIEIPKVTYFLKVDTLGSPSPFLLVTNVTRTMEKSEPIDQ